MRIGQFERTAAAVAPFAPTPAVTISHLVHEDVKNIGDTGGHQFVRHGQRDAFAAVLERAAVIAKGDSIIWDGEFWGMKDTDFEIYKVSEQPVILIHDKVTGHTDQMTVPTLQDRIQKNRSKK